MSRQKSDKELIQHKKRALYSLEQYIDSLINSDNIHIKGKADKLSYWLEDYTNFLNYEKIFEPNSRPKYKRGQIIKVHLGYNIGSEEGGLHYAIVIENNNSIYSPVLTIVPLTSVKDNTNIDKLRKGEIFLGNELYRSLVAKTKTLSYNVNNKIQELKKCLSDSDADEENILDRIKECEQEVAFLSKLTKEITKMKKGSIALVGQITTISKIRIYDPKSTHDSLGNIRMSNETLDKIDNAVIQLYINSKKSC